MTLEMADGEIAEGLHGWAQSGGRTVKSVYEMLRDEILADLTKSLPVDVVLLNLHGSMEARFVATRTCPRVVCAEANITIYIYIYIGSIYIIRVVVVLNADVNIDKRRLQ